MNCKITFIILCYIYQNIILPKEAEGCFCEETNNILLVSIESDALVVTMELLLVGKSVTVFALIPAGICKVTGFPDTATVSYN